MKKILISLLLLGFLGALAAAGALVWLYYDITKDLPQLSRAEDYRPAAVSKVFSSDGKQIAEFFHDERRYPAKLAEIPVMLRNCFIASEDADFYKHPGIDPYSILRALYKNVTTGSAKQGGSTITQQVVKNLLLTSEKNLQRKMKEAILSYRLEKRLTKDEILEIYLNQIFFGNTAYGVKAAAWVYFQKPLDQITIAEGAMLAGLPQAPSKYSPLRNMKEAKRRQRYVLGQMLEAGFINKDQYREAMAEKIQVHQIRNQTIQSSPYYVTEIRSKLLELWKDLDIDTGGYQIYTALDLNADAMLQAAVRKGLREVDKRRGWRGPLAHIAEADQAKFAEQFHLDGEPVTFAADEVYPALVTYTAKGSARLWLGSASAALDLSDATWARRFRHSDNSVTGVDIANALSVGDVVEVALKEAPAPKKDAKEPSAAARDLVFSLDQTPDIEGAGVILDPSSGQVVAMAGGYSFQRSVFNRVTQSLRQPGSSFKPVVYLAAIDGFGYTPATIVYDQPRTFRIGTQIWSPGNFDEKYLGAITLRTALEKSRNLVSAEIISRIGINAVIDYARRLGITSQLGHNLSLSLGSSEVTLLELARAYGVFAAKGVLFPSVMITKILDRDGKVIYDESLDRLSRAKQAINENSAFIMANLMKGVVEHGTGYKVKELGRPVAGKTGTSNDQMDTWFIGYTPEWVCGIWVGFDVKKEIGEKETGGKVAAPIFLYAMRDFLQYRDQKVYDQLVTETKSEADRLGIDYVAPPKLEPLDFSVPPGVDPFWVNKESGLIAEPGSKGAILDYFLKGTEPRKTSADEADSSSYLQSPDL